MKDLRVDQRQAVRLLDGCRYLRLLQITTDMLGSDNSFATANLAVIGDLINCSHQLPMIVVDRLARPRRLDYYGGHDRNQHERD